MAFWHEGCGAALYANFSRFLFVEREREKWRGRFYSQKRNTYTEQKRKE